MAYGAKYRGDFYNANNELCRVDICQDGYSGAVTDIIFGDTPVTRVMDSANKPIYDTIKTTSLEVNLKKEYFTQYEEFLNTDDKSYLVRLYENSVQTFSGWLITSGITEPYRSVPYIISLQAVDGINRLKDVTFATPPEIYTRQFYGAEYYKAWRVSLRTIYEQIITAISPDIIVRSYSNVKGYSNNVGYSIFSPNTYIHYELIKDKSLYDILELILKGLGLKAVIDNNKLTIFGLKEQEKWAYNTTVDYIEFDTNMDTASTGTFTNAVQTIGNELNLLTGGTVTKKPAYKNAKVEVDWGRLDNIFIPGDFSKSVTIENDLAVIHFWQKTGNPNFDVTFTDDGVDKFISINYKASFSNYQNIFPYNYLTAEFDLRDFDFGDHINTKLLISFDVRYSSNETQPTQHVYNVQNIDGVSLLSSAVYVNASKKYKWASGEHGYSHVAGSEWETIEIPIDYLDNIVNKRIRLIFTLGIEFGEIPTTTNSYDIKDVSIKLVNTSDKGKQLYEQGETVEVINNSLGLFQGETIKVQIASPPTTYNSAALYNTMHAYKSSIIIETGVGTFFEVVDTSNEDIPSYYEPLQDYVGKIVATSTMISQSVVNCELKGYLPSWLNPIYNIEEPSKMYFIGSGSYDVKRMRGKYELLQYVPYVGFDWSNIITEDNDIIESEDGLTTLITEININ